MIVQQLNDDMASIRNDIQMKNLKISEEVLEGIFELTITNFEIEFCDILKTQRCLFYV